MGRKAKWSCPAETAWWSAERPHAWWSAEASKAVHSCCSNERVLLLLLLLSLSFSPSSFHPLPINTFNGAHGNDCMQIQTSRDRDRTTHRMPEISNLQATPPCSQADPASPSAQSLLPPPFPSLSTARDTELAQASHVNFGVEFELLLSLHPAYEKEISLTTPRKGSRAKETWVFRNRMHVELARLLHKHGLPTEYHDAADDEAPDNTKWAVTSDSSISSRHQDDGFCKNLRGHTSTLTHDHRARVLMPRAVQTRSRWLHPSCGATDRGGRCSSSFGRRSIGTFGSGVMHRWGFMFTCRHRLESTRTSRSFSLPRLLLSGSL